MENGFGTESYITLPGLLFALSMGLLILILPRKYALAPVFALMCYMTLGERLMIGGLNFTMIRILLLFGWVRLVCRKEIRSFKFNGIDTAVLAWVVSRIILHNVLWQNGKEFQNSLGGAYDEVGMYFLFRFLVRDLDDIKHAIRGFALFIVPVGVLMLNEKLTGHNVFAAFGGVHETTVAREGSLRCQGPFLHPILAGTFGAVVLPFFVGLYREGGRNRLIAALGIVSALTIVVTCASSGPVLACVCGILGLGLWGLRRQMKKILWGIVFTLVLLQLTMKAPVWFLMAKMDVFSGSTGFHRALLIDEALHHIDEWWLSGTKETKSWGGHLEDVTNQYINEGVYGGLLTMALYIRVVARSFKAVGSSVRILQRHDLKTAFCVWTLGAALFAHAITFLSVSYFDQNSVNFYLLLAMISTASSAALLLKKQTKERTVTVPVPQWDEVPALAASRS